MELKFKWTRICTSGCTKIDFRGKLGDNSVLSYKTLIKYFQLPRYNQIWIFFPYIFLFHPILGIAFFHWCRPCQVLAAKVVFDLHISRMKTIMLLVHVIHMILHYCLFWASTCDTFHLRTFLQICFPLHPIPWNSCFVRSCVDQHRKEYKALDNRSIVLLGLVYPVFLFLIYPLWPQFFQDMLCRSFLHVKAILYRLFLFDPCTQNRALLTDFCSNPKTLLEHHSAVRTPPSGYNLLLIIVYSCSLHE